MRKDKIEKNKKLFAYWVLLTLCWFIYCTPLVATLIEILEEKGVLTQEEWEERIRKKIEEAKNLIRFEDMGGEK